MVKKLAIASPMLTFHLIVALADAPCPLLFTAVAFTITLSTFVVFLSLDLRRRLELSCFLKRENAVANLLRKRAVNLLTATGIALTLPLLAFEVRRTPEVGYLLALLIGLQLLLYYLFRRKLSEILRREWGIFEAADLSFATALLTTLLLYLAAHYYLLPLDQPLKSVDPLALLRLKNEIFENYKCPPSAGYLFFSEVLERILWSVVLASLPAVKSAVAKSLILFYTALKGILLLGAGGKLWSEIIKLTETIKR